MKLLLRWVFIFVLVMTNVALAQSAGESIQGVAGNDWTQWNLFGLNAVVIVRAIGEAYSTLKNGGGIVGLWRGLVYGQNVPKVIAQDYKHELKGQSDPLADLKKSEG